MDDEAYYRKLVHRYLKKEATDSELEVFFGLMAKGILQPYLHKAMTSDAEINAVDEVEYAEAQDRKTRKAHVSTWYYAAAAVMIAALGSALYFYRSIGDQQHEHKRISATEILPAHNQATLTLADGQIISLDSAHNSVVMSTKDIMYNNGDIIHTPTDLLSPIAQYALTTPKGGQYQIVLSDGTKVWLNAASTLKYPNKFIGNTREVELDGEAYFAVVKQTEVPNQQGGSLKPFIVKTRNQQVKVVGTEFNLSSYNDENEIKTTLVSGKVWVTNSNGVQQRLSPSEQTILSENTFTKSIVDVNNEIAWHRGRFSFDNKSFAQIMNEMARCYNLEIVYEGAIPTNRFMGGAFRTDRLSTVLRFLENIGVDYRVEEKSPTERRLVIVNKGEQR